jgi:hypothetical protein
MMNYLLKQLNKDLYYLVCMDYNGVLNYLDEVENEPLLQSNAGELVIDQLLVTGNGRNRFLTCQFSYGEIRLDTAKNIDSKDAYKTISAKLLKENIDALKYSILSDSQIDLLRQGQCV